MDKDGQPDGASWIHMPDILDDVLRRGYCDSPPFHPPKVRPLPLT
jgi:hypothetical protein